MNDMLLIMESYGIFSTKMTITVQQRKVSVLKIVIHLKSKCIYHIQIVWSHSFQLFFLIYGIHESKPIFSFSFKTKREEKMIQIINNNMQFWWGGSLKN